jgi:hypothetical protein
VGETVAERRGLEGAKETLTKDVREGRFELPRPCGHRILRPTARRSFTLAARLELPPVAREIGEQGAVAIRLSGADFAANRYRPRFASEE